MLPSVLDERLRLLQIENSSRQQEFFSPRILSVAVLYSFGEADVFVYAHNFGIKNEYDAFWDI